MNSILDEISLFLNSKNFVKNDMYTDTVMKKVAINKNAATHENFNHFYMKWIYAIKLDSWLKLFMPLIWGHGIGMLIAKNFNLSYFFFSMVHNIFLSIYIALLNDWGDQEVDRIKRRMYESSCSPKTIPDRILSSGWVAVIGFLALSMSLVFSWILGTRDKNISHVFLFSLVSAFVFLSYTFYPLRLNYRGGGEILETVGVGFVLPSSGIYLQAGTLFHPLVGMLFLNIPLALASALGSGLADEESDIKGGKQTFVTKYGNQKVRSMIRNLFLLSMLLWFLFWFIWGDRTQMAFYVLFASFYIYGFWQLISLAKEAETGKLTEIRLYKGFLNKFIVRLYLFTMLGVYFCVG